MAIFHKRSFAEKVQLAVSLVIRATIVLAIISAITNQSWTILFVGCLTLVLTFLPAMIERNYKILLPAEFEIIMVAFIYTSLFLGEVHDYYTRFWWWDVILHVGSGLALGFVGFLILFVLYEEKKIRAKPVTIAIFSFSFALAIGASWEIFEFAMDGFLGFNMQKTGLADTMWDLIVDAGGALVTATIGFFYLKGGKHRIFNRLLTQFICQNPKLFGDRQRKKC